MKISVPKTLAPLFCFFAIACGGGGDSDGEGTNSNGQLITVAGIYDVLIAKVTDNCPPGLDETLLVTHTVNQNNNIVALNSGTASFSGLVNPENDGFTVDRVNTDPDCTITQRFAYIESEGESDFAVGFIQRATCGPIGCQATYAGVANLR